MGRYLTIAFLLLPALGGCSDDGDDWCAPPNHDGPVSCPSETDTCSGGSNMTDPRVAQPVDANAAAPVITISWEVGTGPGAALPDAYFEAVEVAERTDPSVTALIQDLSTPAPRTIDVELSSLTSHLESNDTLAFVLAFPDRAAHTDCTHPGMSDRYFLEVTLGFDASGGLASSSLAESVALGDI